MTDVVDLFKANAHAALRGLSDLVSDAEQRETAKQKLDTIEQTFADMASDGTVDPREMEKLIALLQSAGIDGDGLADLEPEALETALREKLERGRAALTMTTTDRFRIALAMQELGDNVRAASEVNSARHRAYMTVIGNMKA